MFFVRVIQQNVILQADNRIFWITKQQNYSQIDRLILNIDVLDRKIFIVSKNNVQIYYYNDSFHYLNVVINQTILKTLEPLANKSFEIIDAQFAKQNQLVLLDNYMESQSQRVVLQTHFHQCIIIITLITQLIMLI
ncbi:unnamed protein product [Paramecium sonneborni]|uniref:Uncharacterized protein n=1 Tax=Paramecium sonneborni TaxID=65129 RepID=A0A8S1RXI1_9CILI|nr:unnamed protein product [Paramecium sonneborni]